MTPFDTAQIFARMRLLRAGAGFKHRRAGGRFIAGGAAALGLADLAGLGAPAAAQPPPSPASTSITTSSCRSARKMNIERQGGKGGPAWSPADVARGHGQGGVANSIPRSLNPGPGTARIEESRAGSRASSTTTAPSWQRPSRPLRPLRRHRAARRRGQPQGDRIRLRHAQGRRHRLLTSYEDKYLGDPRSRRSTRSSTGARPWSTSIRPRRIAAAAWSRHPAGGDRIRDRLHPHHRPPGVQRHGAEVPGHPLDLLPQRRHAPVPYRRFVRLAQERKPAHLPNGPLPEFKKFYYELAQGNTPGQIAALLKMVSISQVMYGTDYPFRDGAEVNQGIADWGFAAADLRAIERETALKLLPRVKAS